MAEGSAPHAQPVTVGPGAGGAEVAEPRPVAKAARAARAARAAGAVRPAAVAPAAEVVPVAEVAPIAAIADIGARLVVFDCETTGTDRLQDQVIELCIQ